jgi:hypothetical protein
MRGTYFGLLLLIAAAPGCAGLDNDGYFENYNGFPWPSLLNKAPPQSRTDTLIQQPQYSQAPRFARPAANSADAAPAEKTSADDAPVEK